MLVDLSTELSELSTELRTEQNVAAPPLKSFETLFEIAHLFPQTWLSIL